MLRLHLTSITLTSCAGLLCRLYPLCCAVQLWRLSSDAPVATFAHSCEVFSMKWSPQPGSDGQGQLLVTSSADNTIRLWDVQAGRCV